MNSPFPDFKNLSVAERIQLVEDIWDSIASESAGLFELDPAQLAELDRRLAAHKAAPDSSIPWEQVRNKLFQRGN